MVDLTGQTALVTAGSRGLGAEIVRELAQAGADVACTYVQDEAAANGVVKEVQDLGRKAIALRADARDYNLAQEVAAKVEAELGPVSILVCNAGIARSAPIAKMSEEDWNAAMDVSLKGTFNYLRAVAPGMQARKNGKIVCVGSINGLRGRMGSASYNTAKAGLVGLVKTAASELGTDDINVNLIAPGFIETPGQERTPELIRDLVRKECAIKRLGTPQDIAPLVVFLASPLARHITGQTIKVDAGQYL